MATARLIKQIVIVTPNEVGTLAKVCAAVRECDSFISHLCASALGDDARFMLNVTSFDSVKESLERDGFDVSVAEVLEIEFENAAGMLEPVARALGDAGVDVLFNYGTSADGRKAIMVMATNDNERALRIINEWGG